MGPKGNDGKGGFYHRRPNDSSEARPVDFNFPGASSTTVLFDASDPTPADKPVSLTSTAVKKPPVLPKNFKPRRKKRRAESSSATSTSFAIADDDPFSFGPPPKKKPKTASLSTPSHPGSGEHPVV